MAMSAPISWQFIGHINDNKKGKCNCPKSIWHKVCQTTFGFFSRHTRIFCTKAAENRNRKCQFAVVSVVCFCWLILRLQNWEIVIELFFFGFLALLPAQKWSWCKMSNASHRHTRREISGWHNNSTWLQLIERPLHCKILLLTSFEFTYISHFAKMP